MPAPSPRVRAGLQFDRGWWRILPGREWLQILARQELRLIAPGADGRALVVSSIDVLGNVTISIDRKAWAELAGADRAALVSSHGAALDQAVAALAGGHAGLERLVRGVRWAIWAVLLPIGGAGSLLAAGRVLFVWSVVLVAGLVLTAGVRAFLRWQLRRLAWSHLGMR